MGILGRGRIIMQLFCSSNRGVVVAEGFGWWNDKFTCHLGIPRKRLIDKFACHFGSGCRSQKRSSPLTSPPAHLSPPHHTVPHSPHVPLMMYSEPEFSIFYHLLKVDGRIWKSEVADASSASVFLVATVVGDATEVVEIVVERLRDDG